MNSPTSMGILTAKPCCRMLVRCNSMFFRISSLPPIPKSLHGASTSASVRPESVVWIRKIGGWSRNSPQVSDVACRNCRFFFGPSFEVDSKRGFRVLANAAAGTPEFNPGRNVMKNSDRGVVLRVSDVRFSSTTFEPRVGDNGLERIYFQNLGVKPLIVEKELESSPDVGSNDTPEVGDQLPGFSNDSNQKTSNLLGPEKKLCKNVEEHVATTSNVEEEAKVREESVIEKEAWRLLHAAVVNYCGSPIGTVAANNPADVTPLNYDQVFIRDFVPSALAFLLKGEKEIVRNFLLHTLQLQSWEKTVDCYSPGQGLMPASFKVRTVPLDGSNEAFEEVLDPDFGESAIGRVAPVDSGLWWIILLRAYGKVTGDYALQERVDVQTGIRLILNLCLADGFDMFPTLLVTDGSCMIDRRMGIHGHPLEIQALYYSALRCAREMIIFNDGSKNLLRAINNRLSALSFHIREYYWVDMKKINEIYRYKTEEYSHDAVNKFNIYPEQIPSWLVEWIPDKGGYLIGNLQPAHMDFRFFSLGNLWSIVSSLTTPEQSESILNLIESKWDDLIGKMPLKICYPAFEYEEWRIITGSDPKNTPWSYHNGGSWPTLLWQFTLACIKMGRPDLARQAISVAEERLPKDNWPEYYDTRTARFIGKQARLYQTWTIAGYLTSKMLLDKPEMASILTCEEDLEVLMGCSCPLSTSPRKSVPEMLLDLRFLYREALVMLLMSVKKKGYSVASFLQEYTMYDPKYLFKYRKKSILLGKWMKERSCIIYTV